MLIARTWGTFLNRGMDLCSAPRHSVSACDRHCSAPICSRSHLTHRVLLNEVSCLNWCFFLFLLLLREFLAPLGDRMKGNNDFVHSKLPKQGLRNTMFSLVGRRSNLGGEIWPYWSLNNIVLVLGIRNWLQHFQPLSTASFLSSCPLSLQGLWGWPCTWRLRWHLQGSCAPVLEWCEWQVIRAGSAATEEGAGVSSRLCSKVRTTSASQNPGSWLNLLANDGPSHWSMESQIWSKSTFLVFFLPFEWTSNPF